ncbi:AMP-binding protein [Maritimibacter sp. DP1N21-5]|nr:AMP-binding protein [Maritimibacter sp. DP1N21-5]
MTPGALHPTSPETFRLHPSTRTRVQGAGDLTPLLDAIARGIEFAVGPSGVSDVQGGVPGFFRTATGGTTGQAKAIRRTHSSWIASFRVNAAELGLTDADRYGVLGPEVHSLSLYAMVEAAFLGADIHALAGLGPRAQARALDGVSVLYATPTQLRLLVGTGITLPALRHVLCGGGRMGADLRRAVATLCPKAVVREFYGAAETSFIAWGDGTGPEGSVGRAYPGVSLRVDAPPGEVGDIWIKSPYLAEGYVGDGITPLEQVDGHVSLGEMGRIDEAGFLTVLGRRNRMVTIADQNVFPEAIEERCLAHPDVDFCAVVPVPDPLRGHVLVAAIGARPERTTGPEVTAQLLADCRTAFGPLAAPRRFMVLDDFPLTAAGKPHYAEVTRRMRTAV